MKILKGKELLPCILRRDFVFNKLVCFDESCKPAGVGANPLHHLLRVDLLDVLVHLRETRGDLPEVGLGVASNRRAKCHYGS